MNWSVLAQSRQAPIELWITCAVLIGLIVLLGAFVLLYRRKILMDPETPGASEVWSLDDLARLRSQGEITEAEYQAMRATIIRSFTGEERTEVDGRFPEIPRGSKAVRQPTDDGEEWDWVAEGHDDGGDRRKTDT